MLHSDVHGSSFRLKPSRTGLFSFTFLSLARLRVWISIWGTGIGAQFVQLRGWYSVGGRRRGCLNFRIRRAHTFVCARSVAFLRSSLVRFSGGRRWLLLDTVTVYPSLRLWEDEAASRRACFFLTITRPLTGWWDLSLWDQTPYVNSDVHSYRVRVSSTCYHLFSSRGRCLHFC